MNLEKNCIVCGCNSYTHVHMHKKPVIMPIEDLLKDYNIPVNIEDEAEISRLFDIKKDKIIKEFQEQEKLIHKINPRYVADISNIFHMPMQSSKECKDLKRNITQINEIEAKVKFDTKIMFIGSAGSGKSSLIN